MNRRSLIDLATLCIDMRFSPADLDGALRLLSSVVGATEAKAGCRSCSVARDASDGGLVRYREEWDSEPAFRRHVRSTEFQRVLVAIDLASEEPEVMVGNLSGRLGLESLRELRGERDTVET